MEVLKPQIACGHLMKVIRIGGERSNRPFSVLWQQQVLTYHKLKMHIMPCEEFDSPIATELSHTIGIPEDELIHRGLISFIEKEIRLAEMDIADLRDRYNVASKEELYEAIKSKKIPSHPAWEDYIVWKNKEKYIKDLKTRLSRVL